MTARPGEVQLESQVHLSEAVLVPDQNGDGDRSVEYKVSTCFFFFSFDGLKCTSRWERSVRYKETFLSTDHADKYGLLWAIRTVITRAILHGHRRTAVGAATNQLSM